MLVTLGPIPYFWEKAAVYRFYEQVADSPVDSVVLGETVCSKRRQLTRADWFAIARLLRDSGKEVLIATLALIEAESELHALKSLCAEAADHGVMVEANDYAAVHLLSRQQQAFAGGAALNIYNANSLRILKDLGMVRWQPPLEASRDLIRDILAATPQPFSTELFAWGYMTLAYSARCYTARAHGLAKDECRFICLEHPAGMQVKSQDGTEVFNLNGIQTQSGRCVYLLNDWQEAAAIGITHMRLSADGEHVLPLLTQLKDAIHAGQSRVGEAGPGACNGYWNQIAGMHLMEA